MMVKFFTFDINARYKNELFQRDRRCLIAKISFFCCFSDIINSSYYTMPCYKMRVE